MPEPAQPIAKYARVHALPMDIGGRSSGGAWHPHRQRHKARLLEAAGILGVVLILSACPATVDRPERLVTPDAIGIIEDVEASEDGTTKTLLLDSGEEVVVHNTRDIEITGDANEGYLLVTGEIGEARWSMFVRSGPETGILPESCYVAGSQPFDDGNFVIFPATAPTGAFGIRLPKAEGFEAEDPNPQTMRWGDFDGAFCLNEQGEVTGQADLLRRETE